MKLKSLIEAGDPEQIATGFQFTEGPVWHPDGYLIFSDIPANRTYKWTPDGVVTIWREPSGFSNGLTLDHQRRVIACEHGGRRVSRVAADGTVVTLADSYGGKRLNSPNDVVVKSDGTIYFTDPPYGLTPPYGPSVQEPEQPCNGLYRITAAGVLELAVRRHHISREEVVTGQTVLAYQPSDPAAEREARDACLAHDATRGGQSVGLCLMIEILP